MKLTLLQTLKCKYKRKIYDSKNGLNGKKENSGNSGNVKVSWKSYENFRGGMNNR
jgi:hypothetical protein